MEDIKDNDNVKEVLFCYLDILGYKEMVKGQNYLELAETIEKSLINANNFAKTVSNATGMKVNNYLIDLNELSINIFSDTIMIKYPLEDKTLPRCAEIVYNFISILAIFYTGLVFNNIFTRGAIVCNKHYQRKLEQFQGDIVVSDALINSYILESQHAKYARVIVDKSIYKYLYDTNIDKYTETFGNQIYRVDLCSFLAKDLNDNYIVLAPFIENYDSETYKNVIKNYKKELGSIYQKYLYLKELFDFIINKYIASKNILSKNIESNTIFSFRNVIMEDLIEI